VASDPSFAIARRFSYLHARNVLYRQDRLADIEAQLQELDEKEQTQWYLSSRRDDGNSSRAQLLSSLGDELHEYGKNPPCAISLACWQSLTPKRESALLTSPYSYPPKPLFQSKRKRANLDESVQTAGQKGGRVHLTKRSPHFRRYRGSWKIR
jgi:hypothetical protein